MIHNHEPATVERNIHFLILSNCPEDDRRGECISNAATMMTQQDFLRADKVVVVSSSEKSYHADVTSLLLSVFLVIYPVT